MAPTTTVQVRVGDNVKTYPLDFQGLRDHLANGGRIGILDNFISSATEAMKLAGWTLAVTGWVSLDASGLAYHIEVRPSGGYKILAAAPINGLPEPEYTA